MKVLLNSTYQDMLDQIKQSENCAIDFSKKEKQFQGKIEELKLKNKTLELEKQKAIETNVELLKAKDSLKSTIEVIKSSNEKLSSKLKIANSRIGGLQAHNNKLSKQILDALEAIKNYKDVLAKRHTRLSVNQYDKKLKPINKKKK